MASWGEKFVQTHRSPQGSKDFATAFHAVVTAKNPDYKPCAAEIAEENRRSAIINPEKKLMHSSPGQDRSS